MAQWLNQPLSQAQQLANSNTDSTPASASWHLCSVPGALITTALMLLRRTAEMASPTLPRVTFKLVGVLGSRWCSVRVSLHPCLQLTSSTYAGSLYPGGMFLKLSSSERFPSHRIRTHRLHAVMLLAGTDMMTWCRFCCRILASLSL